MQTGHQCQVAHNIDHTGHQHEQQRRLAVAQAAEDGGQQVIGHDEEDARAADAHIAGGQVHRFRRGLHQHRDGAGKHHHAHEQHRRQDGKHHRRAADDRADEVRLFLPQIAGDEHRDAHGQLGDHKGDQVEHLAAGGHARQAGGGAKAPHHQQVHGTIGRLQHQSAQNGQHEPGQLFQDAALRKIGLVISHSFPLLSLMTW